MKKLLLAISLTAISFSMPYVFAAEVAPKLSINKAASSNLQTTRNYYQQLLNRTHMRGAELNMLMTMIPKGGDIHHHYSGAIYAETYLDWVEQQGFCIYRESNPANKQEKFRIETKALPAEAAKNCVKVDAIRKDNNFYRELISTWSDMDYGNHVHLQYPPDQHFFNTFGYFSSISKYSTNTGLKLLKERAKAENQQYLETMLKSAPATDQAELAVKIDALTPASSSQEIQQAFAGYADFLSKDKDAQDKIKAYAEEINADTKDIDDAEFTLRVQSYVSRNTAPSRIFAGLYSAFAATQLNSKIVGVNIVGPEHGLVALRDYTLHMQMFAFLKKQFPQVRLSLHAGELNLGVVPPEHLLHHIRSAVEIAGAERIGHGVDVSFERNPDQLIQSLKKRNVAVEINLTSNAFILGVKEAEHPVTLYLRHGVPVVLTSDDVGVSRNNLSNEYLLFTSRYKPSYDDLKKIVYNSIEYSFLTTGEKQQHKKLLDKRFLDFEAAVAKLVQNQAKNK